MSTYKRIPFQLIKPKPLDILRYGSGGSIILGKWTKGTPTTIETLTLLTPLIKQSSKMILPEAIRSKKAFRLFCNTELYDFQDGEVKRQADEFLWKNETYRIMKLGEWEDVSGFTGYEAIACKVDSELIRLYGE